MSKGAVSGGGQYHRLQTLPLLDVTMRAKKATNEALAESAGVAVRTVDRARRGLPVRAGLADIICQALYEKDFSYQKRGPKKGSHHAGIHSWTIFSTNASRSTG